MLIKGFYKSDPHWVYEYTVYRDSSGQFTHESSQKAVKGLKIWRCITDFKKWQLQSCFMDCGSTHQTQYSQWKMCKIKSPCQTGKHCSRSYEESICHFLFFPPFFCQRNLYTNYWKCTANKKKKKNTEFLKNDMSIVKDNVMYIFLI